MPYDRTSFTIPNWVEIGRNGRMRYPRLLCNQLDGFVSQFTHIYECIFIYSFIYTVSTEVDHRHFLFAVSFQIYSKFVFLIDLTHLGRLLPDQIIPLTN